MFFKVFLAAVCAVSCGAANWPQFRGPSSSGVDDSKEAPLEWNVAEGKNVKWRTPVAGLAHASPIVWGDRVYTISAVGPRKADLKVGLYGDIKAADDQDEHEWRVVALERGSGKVIWEKLGHKGFPKVKRHTKASHANSTPATDGERIVAIFGSEGLFCFDKQGDLIWKKDLGPMDAGFFAVPSAQWGFASSPIIHEGRVIVQCDVQTNSFLAAFDLKDGREIWRTARRDVPTWSTPNVAAVSGRKVILANGWHQISGYDFATGKEIWTLDGGGDIPTPTPIFGGELAYFTSAHGKSRPMRAIRLDAKGTITPGDVADTNAAIVWVHPRSGNYMQTPILVGENLFGCADNGVLTCFDAKSGKIHFSERLTPGNEGFTASPVSDGKKIFFSSENGNVIVVPAAEKFSVISTNKLGETCMASPALANGVLYFRTREHLVAIGK
jgi:outer membrane protein assembly factor BamB